MADTELILGLAGIGGTLLAASAGLGSALLLDRRRQAREDREELVKIRTAARLVVSEIAYNKQALDTAYPVAGKRDEVTVRLALALEHSNWSQYAPVLAGMDDRRARVSVTAVHSVLANLVAADLQIHERSVAGLIEMCDTAVAALEPHI